MDYPQALLDFVNAKEEEWTFDYVRKYYADNGIVHSLDLHGISLYATTHFTKKAYFFLFRQQELEKQFPGKPWESWPRWDDLYIIFPEDKEYQQLYNSLHYTAHVFCNFLDKCIDGYIDLSFVNQFIPKKNISIALRPTKDPWKPNVSLNKDGEYYETLDHYIVETQILSFLLKGEGEIFSRIRRCPVCKKYFIPKSLKKKFCSDKCRGAYHYAIEH